MLMGARSTPVRWQEIYYPISSISNRSSLCMLNLSCAYPPHPSTLFPRVGIMGYPIEHCKKAPFPSLRQCQASACEVIFCRRSLQLLHPSFSSICSHHSTSRRPLRSGGGFVGGFGRGRFRYFRRDCMGSEHALGSFSFLSTSASKIVPVNTLQRFSPLQHLGKSE
jgi:hypothetical protein